MEWIEYHEARAFVLSSHLLVCLVSWSNLGTVVVKHPHVLLRGRWLVLFELGQVVGMGVLGFRPVIRWGIQTCCFRRSRLCQFRTSPFVTLGFGLIDFITLGRE